MKNDWMIWFVCLLLFASGVVWGMTPSETAFFKVKDVHDLFEIFSSIATVLAVGLAFVGVNAWRQQVSAEADHALAQRVAVAALRYKETTRIAFGDAQFAVMQFNVGVEGLPVGMLDSFISKMEERLEASQNSRAEFLAVLLECRAIWGNEFSNQYNEFMNFTENFSGCLRTFFKWIRLDKNGMYADVFAQSLRRYYEQFEQEKWLQISAQQLTKIDELTKEADRELKSKLLRGN